MLAFGLAAVSVRALRRIRPFRVEVTGRSMEPTLRPGDCLIATRDRASTKGVLVVVEHPEHPGFEMVKRVGGVPGDRVEGRLLGPDDYWLIGDNAAASSDSRTFGPVGARQIRGVVALRYWPPPRAAWLR